MRLVIRGYFIGSKELIWAYRMWASGTEKKAKILTLVCGQYCVPWLHCLPPSPSPTLSPQVAHFCLCLISSSTTEGFCSP